MSLLEVLEAVSGLGGGWGGRTARSSWSVVLTRGGDPQLRGQMAIENARKDHRVNF
jgi:hypothetical protein